MSVRSPLPGDALVERLGAQGVLRDLDLHFARLCARLSPEPSPAVSLAAALTSRANGDGHVCIELAAVAGLPPAEHEAPCPPLPEWRQALLDSGVVGDAAVDDEPDRFPLVLDAAHRLYLARYWRYERDVADAVLARSRAEREDVDESRLTASLAQLFPPAGDTIDWQCVAAAVAALRGLAIISGGPGTGKTSTVARILALLVEQGGDAAPRIALAAPTGKAAARLSESIRTAKDGLGCAEGVTEAIPENTMTLHRLLGWRPGGYRYGPDNPLPVDVLVVDEVSMVDLPMMARLLAALPPAARLVLLGDRDQLASVEAGSVLGDLCGDLRAAAFSDAFAARLECLLGVSGLERTTAPLADSVVLLTRSYRFGSDSGIARLARDVNAGDARAAAAVLDDPGFADVSLESLDGETLPPALLDAAVAGYAPFLEASDAAAALAAFARFRILCALRVGPLGALALNRAVEQRLAACGLIQPGQRWYRGRPIMVSANHYGLRLFNGDVGLVWPDPEGRRNAAVFATAEGALRWVAPSRLSVVESCYAMTVHKSQGSEFDRALIVLPGSESPVMTRELVYTALTRARERAVLFAHQGALQSVQRRLSRRSGLGQALWPDQPGSGFGE